MAGFAEGFDAALDGDAGVLLAAGDTALLATAEAGVTAPESLDALAGFPGGAATGETG